MDEELVKSWNEVVHKDDDVYHLGDVSLGNPTKLTDILNRLNGNIHLIIGNHEKSVFKKTTNVERFVWVKPYHEMYIGKEFVVMCHYAMRVWNKSHHGDGSVHLYGHSHDSLDGHGKEWGRSMDVGVDSAYRILGEYRPFSFDEVMIIMNKRENKIIDHHGK